MLTAVVMLVGPLICAIIYYVLISFLIFVCEEIWAECKNFKVWCRQGKWDFEWQWKLFKEGFKKYEEDDI